MHPIFGYIKNSDCVEIHMDGCVPFQYSFYLDSQMIFHSNNMNDENRQLLFSQANMAKLCVASSYRPH